MAKPTLKETHLSLPSIRRRQEHWLFSRFISLDLDTPIRKPQLVDSRSSINLIINMIHIIMISLASL